MTTTTSHQIPGAIDDEARNTVPAVRPLVALLAAASAAVVLGVGYLAVRRSSGIGADLCQVGDGVLDRRDVGQQVPAGSTTSVIGREGGIERGHDSALLPVVR